MIASDGHIKLADFGLAKEEICCSTSGADTFCGTPAYLAPEIILRTGHGKGVDWWCLGILLYEMMYKLPPWYNKNHRKMFHGICYSELNFPVAEKGADDSSTPCKNFISALLKKDANLRLGSSGASEVKNHSFFSDVNFDTIMCKQCPVPWKPEPGKIYFDHDVTKMPFDVPSGSDSTNEASSFALTSTRGKTETTDHAFSGFSFTDPVCQKFCPNHLDKKNGHDGQVVYALIENKECEPDMILENDLCVQNVAFSNMHCITPEDGGQFQLEIDT